MSARAWVRLRDLSVAIAHEFDAQPPLSRALRHRLPSDPVGLHPLHRTHASRRPGVAHPAQPTFHLVGPARLNVGRVGREPLREAHAVTKLGQAGQEDPRPGQSASNEATSRGALMPVIPAARVRLVRLLGHHARPQDAHACENVAGAALGPLTGTRSPSSAAHTVGQHLGVAPRHPPYPPTVALGVPEVSPGPGVRGRLVVGGRWRRCTSSMGTRPGSLASLMSGHVRV